MSLTAAESIKKQPTGTWFPELRGNTYAATKELEISDARFSVENFELRQSEHKRRVTASLKIHLLMQLELSGRKILQK